MSAKPFGNPQQKKPPHTVSNEIDVAVSAYHQESASRFDRLETKIDSLSETVIALARAEEKLIGIERSNASMLTSILKLDERLTTQELVTLTINNTYSNFSKVFWAIISGTTTTGVIWYLSQHLK